MRTTLLAGILLLSAAVLFGQSVSSTEDIAVFRLATGGTDLPQSALTGIDRQIRDVFVNIGSHRVATIDERLTQDETAQLLERLKEYESAASGQPAEVRLGAVTLPGAEMKKLAESLLIVVPVVTSYGPQRSQSVGFTAELETSVTINTGRTADAVDHFTIKTIGVGASADAAAHDALGEISRQLVYEIRSLPEVHQVPSIVEIDRSTVLFELGRSSGVHVGDEFAVVSSRELPSGRTVSERTALLVVKEVKEKIAFAQIIYSRSRLRVGDRLTKITRIGFESSLYLHVVAATQPLGSVYSPVFALGTLHTVARGLYNVRPVLGFEIPFAASSIGGSDSYSGPGLPINLYVGAELNWRLWRFDIVPLAALGVGGVLPPSTSAKLPVSVGGGLVQISASYLITSRLKAFIDVGLEQWLPLGVTSLSGWGGFYGGGGLTLAY